MRIRNANILHLTDGYLALLIDTETRLNLNISIVKYMMIKPTK
ncbi:MULTISPECIES: hypothetical protein [Paenibacillus]|nr:MULTISPECIES: hypothetical protein [Paenibacillus]